MSHAPLAPTRFHEHQLQQLRSAVHTDAQADGSVQRFFLGHTAHVVAMTFDAEGVIMATAQV